jgi:hypothetical protein
VTLSMIFGATIRGTVAALAMTAGLAGAQEVTPGSSFARQSQDDAWWTGPMLANSAATLPQGHVLFEPYLYDAAAQASYDRNGARRAGAHSHAFGSLTYILYGLTDRAAVGLIPTAGFNTVSGGPSSSGVRLGDLGLLAQYRLTQTPAGRSIPTISIAVQENIPTGRYDRLGDRPSDGFGSGAYTTTVSVYSQTYFWLPNGRILRTRLNVSQAVSSDVSIEDVSVYGTGTGFRGYASPGSSTFVDGSWEYSLTRSWVLALDATYRHARNTRTIGYDIRESSGAQSQTGILLESGSSDAFALAPALEFSWTPRLGVLLGVRVIAAGRNAAASITPAVAINFVH